MQRISNTQLKRQALAAGALALPLSRRLVRAARYAVTDERIPRPLRWSAAFGLLPVPGLSDVVLVVAAVPLGLFYREPLGDAWRRSATPAR